MSVLWTKNILLSGVICDESYRRQSTPPSEQETDAAHSVLLKGMSD